MNNNNKMMDFEIRSSQGRITMKGETIHEVITIFESRHPGVIILSIENKSMLIKVNKG